MGYHHSPELTGMLFTCKPLGRLPEYADPVYLEGYCNKLKELPKDSETGRIQHCSPRQHFAFGHIDGAEKFCSCNDEF
jgi:hypothetical protein